MHTCLRLPHMLFSLVLCALQAAHAEDFSRAVINYPFGVLNQRSITLTAEYWNPILRYVSKKSGVPLSLRIGRTANETTDLAVKGELAFLFTNHLFTPERDKLGYTVLAREDGEPIRAQIVVDEKNSLRQLKELAGKTVVFANPYAFLGYFVPMDKLMQESLPVNAVFAGNQEAAMGQMRSGKVDAAGVNHKVMADYARREDYAYRVLWTSEPYFDLAVMAHPSVPHELREKVRDALTGMSSDPEGLATLKHSAALLELKNVRGFVSATDAQYENYRAFFRQTRVPLKGQ